MTVIVNKKTTVMGQTFFAPHFFPEGVPPTHNEREKSERLDKILKLKGEQINNQYRISVRDKLLDDIDKWRWLGGQINELLINTKEIDRIDIDNNYIWPAISQYLIPELKRDSDSKRFGTPKDHLRKCWLLSKTRGTKWIKNWAGWDALVDRGEQLHSEPLLLELEKVFMKHIDNIDSRDYQIIFRLVAEKIPSYGRIKDITLIKKNGLRKIAEDIEKKWLEKTNILTEL